MRSSKWAVVSEATNGTLRTWAVTRPRKAIRWLVDKPELFYVEMWKCSSFKLEPKNDSPNDSIRHSNFKYCKHIFKTAQKNTLGQVEEGTRTLRVLEVFCTALIMFAMHYRLAYLQTLLKFLGYQFRIIWHLYCVFRKSGFIKRTLSKYWPSPCRPRILHWNALAAYSVKCCAFLSFYKGCSWVLVPPR